MNANLSPLKIISYSLYMYFTLFSKWKVNLNNNMLIINFKRASVCYPVNVRGFFLILKKQVAPIYLSENRIGQVHISKYTT